MAIWVWAGIWGGIAGAALLVGAFIGFSFPLKRRIVASIMAFGSGVLISALSFELVEEAYKTGGIQPTALGFLAGALVYTGINYVLALYGAKHRKRSNPTVNSDSEGNALAIALGALIDGIPESIVIGLGMLEGGKISIVAVTAIFISNIPEGLSSSVGMKQAGHSRSYVFGVWGVIASICALSSIVGYVFFQGVPPQHTAFVMAIAAGAILAMIVDTMIPEAFEETHNFAGLITVLGFLVAFLLDAFAP